MPVPVALDGGLVDWERLIRDELAPMVPYAPGLRASEVREQCGCDVIHKLSSNENPYGPVPAAVEAMTALLPRLNVYPDGSARALKGALASHLAVDVSNVVVGNGSNELIRLIAQAVLRPGRRMRLRVAQLRRLPDGDPAHGGNGCQGGTDR